MKLLVAIDLSAASTRVIEVARQVALATHAHVYVLHVAEPEPDFVGFEAGPGVVRDQVAEEFRQAHRAVQAFADSLREGGVEASALLVRGPTAQTALTEAERLAVDLIIVGSHGHSALYDVLVGSYSAAILRNSSRPVLVVPSRFGSE